MQMCRLARAFASCAASNDDLCAIDASSEDSAYLRRHSLWTMRKLSISHVLAAKALVSLHISTGLAEPSSKTEISCADSNGGMFTVYYVSSEGCGESAPTTIAHLCNHRCVVSMRQKCSQCVVIKFLNIKFASLPSK